MEERWTEDYIEDYKRVRYKGVLKPISNEGENVEDACKRIALATLEIDPDDVGEDEEYTTWADALLYFCEYKCGVVTKSDDIYVIRDNVLYQIVEQEEIQFRDRFDIEEREDGSIAFDIEFDKGDDVSCSANALNDYFDGMIDLSDGSLSIWDNYGKRYE